MYLTLGYLGVETDFPEQISSLPYKKKRNRRIITRRKRVQQTTFEKENSDRAHHCRLKKYRIQSDIFQKQIEKVR